MDSINLDRIKEKKFDSKIIKRYGISKEELKDMPLSKIKSIGNINKEALRETKSFKLFRNIGKTVVKGASMGAGVSGTINTIFPNIVPVVSSIITSNSNLSSVGKTLGFALAASKPIDMISGYTIIGIGAGIGAVLYSGYSLIRCGVKRVMIIRDRSKARKLCK